MLPQVVVPLAGKHGPYINLFPILVTEKVEAPWNFHHMNLDVLPVADFSEPEPLHDLLTNLYYVATDREQLLRDARDRRRSGTHPRFK